MAPEIVRRLEYEGKAVDMWSLGILLYALLCGCFPFRAKTYPDLYRRIARGTFTIPDELSVPVKDLIKSLLMIDVNDRLTAHNAIKQSWLSTQSNYLIDLNKLKRDIPILISDKPSDDIDEQVLVEIEKYGITRDEVLRVVLSKSHCAIGTLYYLLLDTIVTKRKLNGSYNKKGLNNNSNNNNRSQQKQITRTINDNYQQTQMQTQNGQTQQMIPQILQQQINNNIPQPSVINNRPKSASAAARNVNNGQKPIISFIGLR